MPNAADCTCCIWSLELPGGEWWCHDRCAPVPSDHCCQGYRERTIKIADPLGWARIKEQGN